MLFALLIIGASAMEETNWELVPYGSSLDSEIVNSGEVHMCKDQPADTETCESNLDCGSALCISVEYDGQTVNKCGCGNFERMINSEMVTVCSCDYVQELDTCLPIWKYSIMCKFACKNCFGCSDKNPKECALDKYCTLHAAGTEVATCKDVATPLTPSPACKGHEDECTDLPECRLGRNWTSMNKAVCMDRIAVLMNVSKDEETALGVAIGNNPEHERCPVSMERLVDSYMGEPGNFFDTCVSKEAPDLMIANCKYYEWDGDSCKICKHGWALGMVALKEGTGRIKQNAICYNETNESNNNCEVFVHETKAVAEGHHKCARCKDGFEYPIDENTGLVTAHLCVPEYEENASTHSAPFQIAMFLLGALVLFALRTGFTTFLGKSDVSTAAAWNHHEEHATVELTMSE